MLLIIYSDGVFPSGPRTITTRYFEEVDGVLHFSPESKGDATSTHYVGIHEVLLIPEPAGSTGDPYKPALVYHDSWRFGLDAPMVDGFADLLGTEDAPGKQQ